MLFTYNKSTKNISSYEETDFKTERILERQDIEKWVENCPDILGEELLILTTEYDKFDKTNERLDLLAIDKQGNLVVVELKRDDSGKNVELQAIKYAAYCSTLTFDDVVNEYYNYLLKQNKKITQEKAREEILEFINNDDFEEVFNDKPRIIIAAKEYRPEVTASVLWLRKFGIDITCVKLNLYKADDNTIAVESTILIPLPEAKDFIIKAEKKENVEHIKTLSQQEYLEFYGDLISLLQEKTSLPYLTPSDRAYYSIPTGVPGVHFEWAFHGRPRSSFGVELHFERSNRKFNKFGIDKMEKIKGELEKELGEVVVFQHDWGKRWARVYIEKDEGKMTDDLKKWAVDKMEILYNLAMPIVEKLK